MSRQETTPGPWFRHDTADYAEIHSTPNPSNQALALVGTPADADLISACPLLYAALYDLIMVVPKPLDDRDTSPNAMRYRNGIKALAQARGDS